MNHALLFITTAFLLTACAASDPYGMESPAQSARRADVVDMPTMRAAPDRTPWTAYRMFDFEPAAADVSPSDLPKIKEIVAYLSSNPSLDVGIDGTLTAAGTSEAARSLGNRRAASVRRALMDAGVGVASYKILNGAYADPGRRHAGQVQILLGPRTGSLKDAP